MATRSKIGQELVDVSVQYQVYLERLKAGEVKKLDPVLRRLDRTIRAALSTLTDDPSQRQIQQTLAAMRREATAILDQYSTAHVNSLQQLSRYATEFHGDTLSLVWPSVAPALASPAAAAVWAATLAAPVQATGQLLEPFVGSWGPRMLARVEGAVRTGYAQGRTTQQIIQQVRGTKAAKFQDGIIGGSAKRDAAAVVRTSIQQVSAAAQQAVYEENDDFVEGYQWVSTLDSRTTSQCRSLDGRVFKLGKGPMPPAHVNCRSTTIPKIKGIDLLEGTTRASKGPKPGQVPADETYYEWLKRQPASFQEDALGKSRYQLFRNGGLTAQQFADLALDKNFQPLTLEQMRQKNPAAFRKAALTP